MATKKFLYLLTQDRNIGYDTYDSAIVCAESEDEAKMIHPCDYKNNWNGERDSIFDSWCAAKDVDVKLIGLAAPSIKKGVVLSSFNAG